MATGPDINPDAILGAFERLKKALIDTSSIIYLQKAGYFDALAGTVQLYSIPEVISEFKTHVAGVTLIHPSESPSLSTDQKLISCALENELAMISEDKHMLRAMGRAQAPYYNSLMMLNFLLFSKKIDDDGYQQYHCALENIARYSDEIWEFGNFIYSTVKLRLQSRTLTL